MEGDVRDGGSVCTIRRPKTVADSLSRVAADLCQRQLGLGSDPAGRHGHRDCVGCHTTRRRRVLFAFSVGGAPPLAVAHRTRGHSLCGRCDFARRRIHRAVYVSSGSHRVWGRVGSMCVRSGSARALRPSLAEEELGINPFFSPKWELGGVFTTGAGLTPTTVLIACRSFEEVPRPTIS